MATVYFDGGAAGRQWYLGGHSAGLMFAGRGQIYRHAFTGKWGTRLAAAAAAGFAPTDGNRTIGYTSRNSRYWGQEQCVHNGASISPDSSPSGACEFSKFEGRDNSVADTVYLDGTQLGTIMDVGDWSGYASDNRVAHCVYQNLGGPIFEMRDWAGDGYPGAAPIGSIHFKNCILDRISQNGLYYPGETDWRNLLFMANLAPGLDWRNIIQMHGITVRDATRSLSQLYIYIDRGSSPPGYQTVQWFLDNHPANFSNWTVTSSPLFTNERTLDAFIMPGQIPTHFTPVTTGNGVALTTVAATDAGSGTTLRVNDSRYFRDPRYVSVDGSASSIAINCNGANRVYTAINYATHELTMQSGFTRSSGMAVHRSITTGSAPNRGAVR